MSEVKHPTTEENVFADLSFENAGELMARAKLLNGVEVLIKKVSFP